MSGPVCSTCGEEIRLNEWQIWVHKIHNGGIGEAHAPPSPPEGDRQEGSG